MHIASVPASLIHGGKRRYLVIITYLAMRKKYRVSAYDVATTYLHVTKKLAPWPKKIKITHDVIVTGVYSSIEKVTVAYLHIYRAMERRREHVSLSKFYRRMDEATPCHEVI